VRLFNKNGKFIEKVAIRGNVGKDDMIRIARKVNIFEVEWLIEVWYFHDHEYEFKRLYPDYVLI
jgi:hypothetical protein